MPNIFWIIWFLCGVIGALIFTRYFFRTTGYLSLFDVLALIIAVIAGPSCLFGAILLCENKYDHIIFKKKD